MLPNSLFNKQMDLSNVITIILFKKNIKKHNSYLEKMAMLSMFILMFLLVPYVQDVANWVTDSNFLLDSKHHTSKHLPWPQGGRMYFLLTLSLTIFLVWVNLMFMDVKQAKASKTLMCLDCLLDLWEDLRINYQRSELNPQLGAKCLCA